MIHQRAFTLIEMVAVLVLVGILAALAIPRLPVGSDFEGSLQARNLAGLLRLAQLRAMNDPDALQEDTNFERCGVVAVTADGISLSADCKSANLLSQEQLNTPGQSLWLGVRDLPVTANVNPPFTLQFGKEPVDPDDKIYLSEDSRLGRPFVDGGQLTDTLQITLAGQTVLIEPEGYIHAQP